MSVSITQNKVTVNGVEGHTNGCHNGSPDIQNGSSCNGNGMHDMYNDFLHMDSYMDRSPEERYCLKRLRFRLSRRRWWEDAAEWSNHWQPAGF